jgi:hypothetical protein
MLAVQHHHVRLAQAVLMIGQIQFAREYRGLFACPFQLSQGGRQFGSIVHPAAGYTKLHGHRGLVPQKQALAGMRSEINNQVRAFAGR